MRNNWKIIKEAYEVLKEHESRWMFDNDYRRRYEYVKEAVTEHPRYTPGTVEYIADCALFLLKANERIYGEWIENNERHCTRRFAVEHGIIAQDDMTTTCKWLWDEYIYIH